MSTFMLPKPSLLFVAFLTFFVAFVSAETFKVFIHGKNGYFYDDVTIDDGVACTPKALKQKLQTHPSIRNNANQLVFCNSSGKAIENDKVFEKSNSAIESGSRIEILVRGGEETNILAYRCSGETFAEILKRVKGKDHNLLVDGVEDLNTKEAYMFGEITVFPNDMISVVQGHWHYISEALKGFAKRDKKSIAKAIVEKSQEANKQGHKSWSLRFKRWQDVAVCDELPKVKTGKPFELKNDFVVVGDRDGVRLVTVCPNETYDDLKQRLYKGKPFTYKAVGENMSHRIDPKYKLKSYDGLRKCKKLMFYANENDKPIDVVYSFTVDAGYSSKFDLSVVFPFPESVNKSWAPITASQLAKTIVEQNEFRGLSKSQLTVPICLNGEPLKADDDISIKGLDTCIDRIIWVKVEGKDSRYVFLCSKSTIGHASEQIKKAFGTDGEVQFMKKKSGFVTPNPNASLEEFKLGYCHAPYFDCKVVPLVKAVEKGKTSELDAESVDKPEKTSDTNIGSQPTEDSNTPKESTSNQSQVSNNELKNQKTEKKNESKKKTPKHKMGLALVVAGASMLGFLLVVYLFC